MKFIYPRDIILSCLPKLTFRLDAEDDYEKVVTSMLPEGDVEITEQLIIDLCDATHVGYIGEVAGNLAKQSTDVLAAVLISAPYNIFMELADTVMPVRRYRVFANNNSVVDHPVFKQMWSQLTNKENRVEDKVSELLSRSVGHSEISHSFYIKQLTNEVVKKELNFIDNPSKYVKYLPELVNEHKWRCTISDISALTAIDLECIGHVDWTDALYTAILKYCPCVYDITPQSTPLVHEKLNTYLYKHFEGNYTSNLEGSKCIRPSSRQALLAFMRLNRGHVLETDYFITKFGDVSLNLHKHENTKLARNGSFGAFGRPRESRTHVKPVPSKSVSFAMHAVVEDKPTLEPGVYLSILNRTYETVLPQLAPETPTVTDVYNYENVDCKYVIIKPTTTDTLALIKEQRMLYHIARKEKHDLVIFISAEFGAEAITALPNVSCIIPDTENFNINITTGRCWNRRRSPQSGKTHVDTLSDVAFLKVNL